MRRSALRLSGPFVICHWSFIMAAALAAAPSSHAQRYLLANGAILPAADVSIVAGALVQTVKLHGGESYERRYPVAEIARLDFPEPPALDEAEPLVASGQAEAALKLLDPIHRQFAPFPKTPGSPWPRAASLRLQALLLGPDTAAVTAAARELMQTGLGPDVTGFAKLALAQLDARAGHESLARLMLEEIVKDAPPPVQARAWLLRGDLAAARAAHTEALECYLRIPAFFGTLDELMPAALLGAARAYRAYGDTDRAERSALELLDAYPATLQAKTAKTEFGL
jgi:tetratricopeptide (TPR) repeat protein